jgi:hypothetical protein
MTPQSITVCYSPFWPMHSALAATVNRAVDYKLDLGRRIGRIFNDKNDNR